MWVSATAEAAAAREHSILRGVTVDRLMVRRVVTLAPGNTLGDAVRDDLGGFQHDFPVLENGAVVGVLSHPALIAGLAQRGAGSLVSDAMERSFRTAEPGESADAAVERLRNALARTLPVLADGQLTGVLTAENVEEFIMIETARKLSAGNEPGAVQVASS